MPASSQLRHDCRATAALEYALIAAVLIGLLAGFGNAFTDIRLPLAQMQTVISLLPPR